MTGKQRATETKESTASSQQNISNRPKPAFLTSASLHPVLQLQQNIGNQGILRLLKSGIGHDMVFAAGQHAPGTESVRGLRDHQLPSLLHAHILQRAPVFKKCKDKEETLNSAIDEAKKLASMASSALKGERLEAIEKEHVQTALKNNFGDVTDKQKTTITERDTNIHDTLDSKKITCVNREKKEKKKAICAEAPINSQEIAIFLHFWRNACGSKGEMMLHEAAHNAGAEDDIHLDEGYPPKTNAEDNAYSYQFFAVDVQKGPPRVRLGDPQVPKK